MDIRRKPQMKYAIFGPPAVGKSTTLGVVAQAVGDGFIPYKLSVVDFEAGFGWDPRVDEIISLLEASKESVLVGGDGVDYRKFDPKTWVRILLLPVLSNYRKMFFQKMKNRGVGTHDWQEAITVYNGFLAQEREFVLAPNAYEVVRIIKNKWRSLE
jgi:hypothetical protein